MAIDGRQWCRKNRGGRDAVTRRNSIIFLILLNFSCVAMFARSFDRLEVEALELSGGGSSD